MGLGGPVWHASAAATAEFHLSSVQLRDLAYRALEGVGDRQLGEWEEWTGYAYHVRRRLSEDEQRAVGDVKDIRGTAEARRRLAKVARYVRASPDAYAVYHQELNRLPAAAAQKSPSYSEGEQDATPPSGRPTIS